MKISENRVKIEICHQEGYCTQSYNSITIFIQPSYFIGTPLFVGEATSTLCQCNLILIIQGQCRQIFRYYIFILQVLVEFDEVSWDTREWLNVYKENYQLLAVEHTLVLASRAGQRDQGNLCPALVIIFNYFLLKQRLMQKKFGHQ